MPLPRQHPDHTEGRRNTSHAVVQPSAWRTRVQAQESKSFQSAKNRTAKTVEATLGQFHLTNKATQNLKAKAETGSGWRERQKRCSGVVWRPRISCRFPRNPIFAGCGSNQVSVVWHQEVSGKTCQQAMPSKAARSPTGTKLASGQDYLKDQQAATGLLGNVGKPKQVPFP